jgi:carbon-monoxide dehydrogenase medium subunit
MEANETSFGSSNLTLPDFEYVKPVMLHDALELVDQHKDEAKILAGGVGLIAFMKERLVEPRYVVDIKGIAELQRLTYDDHEGLTIGAAVNMNQLLEFTPIKQRYGALRDCVAQLSDPVIRNRSTLLGDICEALPFIDGTTPLLVYDTEIEAASVEGTRRISITDFVKGLAETALKPNEIAVAAHLKVLPENSKTLFLKHNSNSHFSIANVAALCANASRSESRVVRFAYGAVSPVPKKVKDVEVIFKREARVAELIDEAVDVIKKSSDPMTDALAKSDYRLHMLEVLSLRALRSLLGS